MIDKFLSLLMSMLHVLWNCRLITRAREESTSAMDRRRKLQRSSRSWLKEEHSRSWRKWTTGMWFRCRSSVHFTRFVIKKIFLRSATNPPPHLHDIIRQFWLHSVSLLGCLCICWPYRSVFQCYYTVWLCSRLILSLKWPVVSGGTLNSSFSSIAVWTVVGILYWCRLPVVPISGSFSCLGLLCSVVLCIFFLLGYLLFFGRDALNRARRVLQLYLPHGSGRRGACREQDVRRHEGQAPDDSAVVGRRQGWNGSLDVARSHAEGDGRSLPQLHVWYARLTLSKVVIIPRLLHMLFDHCFPSVKRFLQSEHCRGQAMA